MDFNFDGKGFGARKINLGGSTFSNSSNRTPSQLAASARQERANREEIRNQNSAAVKLQSLFRSTASAKNTRQSWATQFDEELIQLEAGFQETGSDLDHQILIGWVHLTRLLVFSSGQVSSRAEWGSKSKADMQSVQSRLDNWCRIASQFTTDSQSILLLPFSAPSITSSYSTLLPLILKLLLSQLSTQPSILSQSSALSYIKILDILLSSNGQASKTTLPSQTGINVAQFLADKLIRNGFHSSLRRHLLNFPIDRKSSSTLSPTISLSLSIFKLFSTSILPGNSSSTPIIIDSEELSSNLEIPTRSFALSTFISEILTIPNLLSRIPISSIPTLTNFPFLETLSHIKALGNYVNLENGESVLKNNPLKNPYLLANFLALGSKRVGSLDGKWLKEYLEAVTVGMDCLEDEVFLMEPIELKNKGKGDAKGKGKERAEELGMEMEIDEEINETRETHSMRKEIQADGEEGFDLPLDASTYKWLSTVHSEAHLSSLLSASNKFPSTTRIAFCSFICSILSSWNNNVREKVLSSIMYGLIQVPPSSTSNSQGLSKNLEAPKGPAAPTSSGLIREIYRSYIRTSKLCRKISSATSGNGAREVLSTLVDENYKEDWSALILVLELYSRALLTIGDDEFYPKATSSLNSSNNSATSVSRNPLSLDEIISLSGVLRNLAFSLYWNEGIGILANLQSKPSQSKHPNTSNGGKELRLPGMKQSILSLRNLVTKVLQQFHSRDSRKSFVPEGHWLMVSQMDLGAFIQTVVLEEQELSLNDGDQDQSDPSLTSNGNGVSMDLDPPSTASGRQVLTSTGRLAGAGHGIQNRNRIVVDDEDDGMNLSEALPISNRLRNLGTTRGLSAKNLAFLSPRLGVLNNIPFVIPFEVRIEIFRQFIRNDAQKLGIQRHNFSRQQRHRVTIRRDHIANDGFLRLNSLGSSLKGTVEIVFIDQFGEEEAGIDGGGVFKEFLTSLVKEAFDTNRGLWKATENQELYPNPHSYSTQGESLEWYTFLGRVLGKALYEGILVDIKFAGFFLSKWLGKGGYLDDLASLDSLDKELYKGLIYLKNYQGNVEQDLALNFTVTDDEFGETKTTELIPGGAGIAVTRENRLSYIYRVSHYRLSTQISKQCQAFFAGLSEMIDPRWLRMLNREELRFLVAGTEEPIDIDDLRANTVYGGYHEKDASVEYFWEALRTFNQERRKSFLKFVTSCPSPPLLGFSQLNPKFAIRLAGEDDTRLPTASTCVNLLKLPRYKSLKQCQEKLAYAIDSGAGFDLS